MTTFGAEVDAALIELRELAAARLTDSCRITKPAPADADPVWNPTTGQYDTPGPVTVYEGPCRIPSRGSSFSRSTAGAESWAAGEFPLDLPFTDASAQVAPDMTVTYLSAAHDPSLVGRVFKVSDPLWSSQSTARRFKMTTNVGP